MNLDQCKEQFAETTVKGEIDMEGRCQLFLRSPNGDREPIPLGESLRLRNHSPTGFSWGYNGSGPSQTALAILLALTGTPEIALQYYIDFRSKYIAFLPRGGAWGIKAKGVFAWLETQMSL